MIKQGIKETSSIMLRKLRLRQKHGFLFLKKTCMDLEELIFVGATFLIYPIKNKAKIKSIQIFGPVL